MRNYALETERRVEFIRDLIRSSRAEGIVYGNSGGKDSALVGILCKMASENTVGVVMPCGSKRNYESDRDDAEKIAAQYDIAVRLVDLTAARDSLVQAVSAATAVSSLALLNIAPRLRMTALYAIAASENRLVAGTGNRSERHMGYFTKWGDGACDFNPIADLTVTEIYEFLRHLGAPEFMIDKAPSAGLFDGQTDEEEMGVKYQSIDAYLQGEAVPERDQAIITRSHSASEHKRHLPRLYGEES